MSDKFQQLIEKMRGTSDKTFSEGYVRASRRWADELEALAAQPASTRTKFSGCTDRQDQKCANCGKMLQQHSFGECPQPASMAPAGASWRLVNELEREIVRLNEDLRLWSSHFRLWRGAWLRHLGGVIVRKHHEIDGFGLRHEQQLKEEYERGKRDARDGWTGRDKWIDEVGEALGKPALAAGSQASEKKS